MCKSSGKMYKNIGIDEPNYKPYVFLCLKSNSKGECGEESIKPPLNRQGFRDKNNLDADANVALANLNVRGLVPQYTKDDRLVAPQDVDSAKEHLATLTTYLFEAYLWIALQISLTTIHNSSVERPYTIHDIHLARSHLHVVCFALRTI